MSYPSASRRPASAWIRTFGAGTPWSPARASPTTLSPACSTTAWRRTTCRRYIPPSAPTAPEALSPSPGTSTSTASIPKPPESADGEAAAGRGRPCAATGAPSAAASRSPGRSRPGPRLEGQARPFPVGRRSGARLRRARDQRQRPDGQPQECRDIRDSGIHHTRYRMLDGLDAVALSMGAVLAAIRPIVKELASVGAQRLVVVQGIAPGKRHTTVDPAVDPPRYWPTRAGQPVRPRAQRPRHP